MTTVVAGELKRTDLCAECAQESGALQAAGFLAPEALVMGPEDAPVASHEKCPACGYPLGTLSKTGRLGCAVCYEKFSDHLAAALQESQKALVHVGKRPGRKNARREELEAELKKLIRSEQFEEAAQVRDRIAKLNPPARRGKTG
jgi:protein arginine kinase activator